MFVSIPTTSQISTAFKSLPIKQDYKAVIVLAGLAALFFLKLRACNPVSSASLTRKTTLSRIPTFFKKDKTGFTLANIKNRVNKYISLVLKSSCELPVAKIQANLIWIKDIRDQLHLKLYCLFKNTAKDREIVNSKLLKFDELSQVIAICKKHSDVHPEFAIYQAVYTDRSNATDADLQALENLCKNWEKKGIVLLPREGIDFSYRPLLRSYRDALLFFAPYIGEETEKLTLLLIQAAKAFLLKEHPQKIIDLLSTSLPPLFNINSNIEPIAKALEELIPLLKKDLADQLYTTTIFPLFSKATTSISREISDKALQVLYRQVRNHNTTPSPFDWLKELPLKDDSILTGMQKLVERETNPTQQQLLQELFSGKIKTIIIKEFLMQQMLDTFDQSPKIIEKPLKALKTWNEQQPLTPCENRFLYTYFLRTEEKFVFSVAMVDSEETVTMSTPIIVPISDIVADLGQNFKESDKLNDYLLRKCHLSSEQPIKDALSHLL